MSKKFLCGTIQPRYCEPIYGDSCMITKSGATIGACRKIKGGPDLKNILPEHLIGYTGSNSKNSNAEAGAVAAAKAKAAAAEKAKAAAAAEKAKAAAADAKAEEERKQKAAEAERKRKAAAAAARAAAANDDDYDEYDDMDAIMAKIAKMEKEAANDDDSGLEDIEYQEAVLSAQTQLAASRGNSCVDLPFYKNIDNSCYMDSIIFTLMAFPSSFVEYYLLGCDMNYIRRKISGVVTERGILDHDQIETIIKYVEKIQRILIKIDHELKSRRITTYLNNVPVQECVSLRRELLRSPFHILEPYNRGNHFGNITQEDATEFIIALFRTFFIENLSITETMTYASTSRPDKKKEPTFSHALSNPLYQVDPDSYDFTLPNFILSKTFISEFDKHNLILNSNGGRTIDKKNTFIKLEVSDADKDQFIIINLKRFDLLGERILSSIKPPTTIRLNEDSPELELNNIIAHVGPTVNSGHYVAYFKCNDNWYLYNDLDKKAKIERVGTYEQLLKHRILDEDKKIFKYPGNVENNAVLLFYSNNNQRI